LLLFSLRLSLFSLGSDVECTACGLEPLHGVGIKCTGHLQWSFPVVNPALGGRDRERLTDYTRVPIIPATKQYNLCADSQSVVVYVCEGFALDSRDRFSKSFSSSFHFSGRSHIWDDAAPALV